MQIIIVIFEVVCCIGGIYIIAKDIKSIMKDIRDCS